MVLINCLIMGINPRGDDKYELDLLPIVDLSTIFHYYGSFSKMVYKIGDFEELDFNEITFSYENKIKELEEKLRTAQHELYQLRKG